MYWQKRFDRPNPDQEIEGKMLEIRKEHKDYGCLRLKKELENQGIHVNKKKIQRLIKKTRYRSKVLHSKISTVQFLSWEGWHCRQKSYSSSVLYKYLSPKNYN